ncbi:MAG TPA: hypothetical protein VK168_10110 [Saprospiraceae bacterium]|nr:hypothetical protein [Saprospiraceae bacterium]
MINNLIRVFPVLILLIGCSGCAYQPVFYQPNTLQLPFTQNAGEGEGSFLFHPDATYAGQLMYSPAKHVLLGGNIYGMTKGDRENYQPWTTGKYLELGQGAYINRQDLCLSLMGWMGRGSFYNRFSSKADAQNSFLKSTVQTGLAYRDKHFHIGMGLRMGYLYFDSGRIGLEADEQSVSAFQTINQDKERWFWGAAFSLGFGFKPLYLSVQLMQEVQFGYKTQARLPLTQSGGGITLGIPVSKK